MAESSALLPIVQKYIESDPVAAARSLETLAEEDAAGVVGMLTPALAAKVIPHLQVSYAAALLKDAGPQNFKTVAQKVGPKRAATIFMHLPVDARERFLPQLPEKLKREIQELLSYPEESVGRIMATSFLTVRKDMRVRDAIHKIRMSVRTRQPMSYAYVVEEDGQLAGVLSMHDILVASSDVTVGSLMRTGVFALHCFTPLAEAAEELSKRRYFSVPVVDSQNRILGIIKAEQLLTGMQEEITEDIQRMFGAGRDERAFSPIRFSLRKRLPWLHVNLATAFLAAGVVALFEGTIQRLTLLAVFLPVVAGQGGNAGAQSLAIVMRGLVMREIPRQRIWHLIAKEGLLGSITGLATGGVTALFAWLWSGNPFLGLVVGLGMVVNLACAGLAGASIPIVMKALGLDPAQCSSIILTTVTDVVGFLAFLGLAGIFISHLV